MSKEKILRKIRRLIALANDQAASDNEVQVALAKAQSLIAEHKINESDINISIDEVDSDWIDIYEDYEPELNYYINSEYIRILVKTICDYNFCRAIVYDAFHRIGFETFKYYKIRVIGKDVDRENVLNLYRFAKTKFLQLAKVRYQIAKREKVNMKGKELVVTNSYIKVDKRIFLRSYLKGTIKGLKEKFEANKLKLDFQETYSLIVADHKLVIQDYIKKNIGELGFVSSRTSKLDKDAYEQGKKDAKVNERQIGQG